MDLLVRGQKLKEVLDTEKKSMGTVSKALYGI
jgi:hypothetical protein